MIHQRSGTCGLYSTEFSRTDFCRSIGSDDGTMLLMIENAHVLKEYPMPAVMAREHKSCADRSVTLTAPARVTVIDG